MKSKILSNYHNHTYLCKHAEGKPDDYAKLAIKLGYHTIAITDHGPLIDEILKNFHTRRMTMQQYYDDYLPQLEEAVIGNPQIKVLKGLEIEYFKEMEDVYRKYLQDLDFLILGEHYFHHLGRYYNVYEPMDEDALEDYTNDVIEGIESGFFKIVAHPDIFYWNYERWDEKCEACATRIIKAAIANKVILEINANGIRNSLNKNKLRQLADGYIDYAYPTIHFWRIAKKLNAPVIINDDCHYFKNLKDDATISAYELAEDLELEIVDHLLK